MIPFPILVRRRISTPKERWLEALSTAAMMTCFFIASLEKHQPISLRLGCMYFSHWVASCYFHLSNYGGLYLCIDKIFIYLLICERLEAKHFLLGWFGRCSFLFLRQDISFTRTLARWATNTIVVCAVLQGAPITTITSYVGFQILSSLLNKLSDFSTYLDATASYVCPLTVCFHVCLGFATYLEERLPTFDLFSSLPPLLLHHFFIFNPSFQYISYIYAVFEISKEVLYSSETTTSYASYTQRLSKICTFFCSFLLSFVGMFEVLMIIVLNFSNFSNFSICKDDYALLRPHFVSFYLAYTRVDSYLGYTVYPDYFRFLEGKIHHLVTGWVTVYALCTGNVTPLCKSFICEIPTVLLSGEHLFPSSFLKEWKRRHFPWMFLFFRVLLLFALTVDSFNKQEIGYDYVSMFCLFTMVNLYWWLRMRERVGVL
jgi:hypothetical protein